jgi:ribosomal protein S12 methylthiotransferase accessory factor
MSILSQHLSHFEVIQMSPRTWPVAVAAVMAGPRTRQVWPGFPLAAESEEGRLGHGADPDMSAALRRATGEMVEIASCCAWGDERLHTASIAEVGSDGWSPVVLSGFSDDQRKGRDAWNRKLEGLDWIPPEADPHRPIEWIRAECLHSGQPVLVPADCVLIGRRIIGDVEAVGVADTNGCAAGEVPEDALHSALFELIERDATGRWWYGRATARPIAPEWVGLDRRILSSMQERARVLRLLDITSEIGVPTVAALGSDRNGTHVAAGFATRMKITAAAQAAITELMQMELKVAFARSRDSLDPGLQTWFAEVLGASLGTDVDPLADPAPLEHVEITSASACLSRLHACGIRVARLDCSRPEFGVPVIRVISPDLCHWKPRFGRTRLIVAPDRRPMLAQDFALRPDFPLLRI